MAKPDRAARVAGRFVRNQSKGEWGERVEAQDASALARLIRREVKRAVEECAQIAATTEVPTDQYAHYARQCIVDAIRARGQK